MSTFQNSPINNLLKDELTELINRANLGTENEKIAKCGLIERQYHADIAAEFGYSRSTVSKRLAKIVKRLEKTAKKCGYL